MMYRPTRFRSLLIRLASLFFLTYMLISPHFIPSTGGKIGQSPSAQQPQSPEGYLGPLQPIPSGPAVASASGPLSTLLASALPNVRINDKTDDSPDQSQSETTIAVDPTNPLSLVGGFNDCRGFFFPDRNGISGIGYSTDGGVTWTPIPTGLPKANAADFGTRGDPSIDVDNDGNFYYASLYEQAGNPAFNVSVHKGRFTGGVLTFDTPTFATNFTSGSGADKDHVGVDKNNGFIYVSYTNFSASGNGQIEVVRSTDGGQTWSTPVVIASASRTVHQGSLPRVGPDGEIYVVWEDGFAQGTARSIHISKSTNWPRFGHDTKIADITAVGNPVFNSRINEFPTMAIDTTSGPERGRVYVAWNDGSLGGAGMIPAILMSHSADGKKWSDPIELNDDGDPSATGTAHWFPWLAVDPSGTVNVIFYDRRLSGSQPDLTDVFAAQFTVSGGLQPNQRITNLSFSMNVPSACTPNFGDYNGAAAGAANIYAIWGDGREGNPDTYAGGLGAGAAATTAVHQ
ncbi:MAG: exo-alpha-sialidase [Blastocatellia bacterium]|nr:exo-alpha-sialidase [Blastocatellia bacterium]